MSAATLSRFGSVVKTDSVESGGSYITWAALSSFEFLEAAAARDKIEITEPGRPRRGSARHKTVDNRTVASDFGIATAMRYEAGLTTDTPNAGDARACRHRHLQQRARRGMQTTSVL